MFATLLGALPMPPPQGHEPGAAAAIDAAVRSAIAAQVDARLEPVTDGRLRDPGFEGLAASLGHRVRMDDGSGAPALAVDWWRFSASQTDRAVKQALPGPYTLGRRLGLELGEPEDLTARLADALRAEIEALAVAGCPLIEIEELDAHLIGEDEGERRLFREAHRRLADGLAGTHLSLSIVGGSAAGAGVETILDAPYGSLAVDLIAGPDNWNLVTRLRGDRGVIAGALPGHASPADSKELLLWAAHYAASSGGRGFERVGLGSAGSWANLTWAAAVAKMQRLGEAARLASLPPSDELLRSLEPAAVSARRAALGHDAPPRPRGRRR